MIVTVRPVHVALMLLAVVAVLTALSMLSLYLRFALGLETVVGLNLVGMLHLDADISVPGWYSATALFLAALVTLAIAVVRRSQGAPYWPHWMGLTVALCYLSVDETARLHEQSPAVMAYFIEHESFFTRSWTVLAAVAVALFALAYLRFVLSMERWQRIRFMSACSMYVIGAVGLEVVGHYYIRPRFPTTDYGVVPYQTVVHLEEVLEMGAIVLLIYAALRELEGIAGTLRIQLTSDVRGVRPGGTSRS